MIGSYLRPSSSPQLSPRGRDMGPPSGAGNGNGDIQRALPHLVKEHHEHGQSLTCCQLFSGGDAPSGPSTSRSAPYSTGYKHQAPALSIGTPLSTHDHAPVDRLLVELFSSTAARCTRARQRPAKSSTALEGPTRSDSQRSTAAQPPLAQSTLDKKRLWLQCPLCGSCPRSSTDPALPGRPWTRRLTPGTRLGML
ncbi:hypothetical protein BD413DRAFT_267062 [Trametes elegans]|nr:hypothetical protein BD413DRAFT_267062 [Trametes elegans]